MEVEKCLHDIPQPVYISVLDGIHIEEIMLHEGDTAIYECLRVFFWPDNVLALFEHWASILDHEFQFRIEFTELDIKTACAFDRSV